MLSSECFRCLASAAIYSLSSPRVPSFLHFTFWTILAMRHTRSLPTGSSPTHLSRDSTQSRRAFVLSYSPHFLAYRLPSNGTCSLLPRHDRRPWPRTHCSSISSHRRQMGRLPRLCPVDPRQVHSSGLLVWFKQRYLSLRVQQMSLCRQNFPPRLCNWRIQGLWRLLPAPRPVCPPRTPTRLTADGILGPSLALSLLE
jgi:hypothetical protein